jgi:hypothetical protein
MAPQPEVRPTIVSEEFAPNGWKLPHDPTVGGLGVGQVAVVRQVLRDAQGGAVAVGVARPVRERVVDVAGLEETAHDAEPGAVHVIGRFDHGRVTTGLSVNGRRPADDADADAAGRDLVDAAHGT